jgi:hypothetical protein
MRQSSQSHPGAGVSSIFRILIIISGVLMWVPSFAPFWYVNTEDRELWNLLQSDGYSASIGPDSVIYRVWPAAFVGILFGLYFYWRPARTAFLLFLVASIALSAFEGVRVAHPIDTVVGGLMYPIYGALIAMSYLTPVANEFEPKRPAVATGDAPSADA